MRENALRDKDAGTMDLEANALQYGHTNFVAMATSWVLDLPNMKGFAGHHWHSVLIFANRPFRSYTRNWQVSNFHQSTIDTLNLNLAREETIKAELPTTAQFSNLPFL